MMGENKTMLDMMTTIFFEAMEMKENRRDQARAEECPSTPLLHAPAYVDGALR